MCTLYYQCSPDRKIHTISDETLSKVLKRVMSKPNLELIYIDIPKLGGITILYTKYCGLSSFAKYFI